MKRCGGEHTVVLNMRKTATECGHGMEYPVIVQNENERLARMKAGGEVPETVAKDAEMHI